MGKPKDSGRVDLARVFIHVQRQMLARLSISDVLEHPSTCGAATEQQWLDLFNQYLPQRYRASAAFVVDADGRRSRQIDIAIYDHFYSPLLFHQDSGGLHVPAESVYAVFEVKQTATRQLLLDAAEKAASVRRLRRTSTAVRSTGSLRPALPPPPILAGFLARDSFWRGSLTRHIEEILRSLAPEQQVDLGCVLLHGAFEFVRSDGAPRMRFSNADQSLIFFMLRLFHRLQEMGTAPALDLSAYAGCLARRE